MCDEKYAGFWTEDANGEACPSDEPEEEEVTDETKKDGSTSLAAAAVAIGTVLFFWAH